jgi:DNA-binding GntR family transcriptional regulator
MANIMANQATINRGAGKPAYMQLVDILRDQVAEGVYLPGQRLPPESALCRRYSLSPMTVRRSINHLLDQGIVSTVQGSGTFVKGPDLDEVTFSLAQFQRLFKDKNRTRVEILEVRIDKADEAVAARLAVAKGAKTIYMRRVLLRDGDPVLYHKEQLIYDPKRPIVETELGVTALHGLFVGGKESQLKSGTLSIEAAVLTKEDAEVLNTIPMQPAFLIEHLFYDFDDRPISWGRFVCRGDRLKFTTTVGLGRGN